MIAQQGSHGSADRTRTFRDRAPVAKGQSPACHGMRDKRTKVAKVGWGSLNPLPKRSDQNGPVYYESTMKPLRVAGAGWGIGIGAYGASRLKSVNAGVKRMQQAPGHDVRELGQSLGRGIGVTQRLSAPAGVRLRSIMERQPEGRYLLDRVPHSGRMGLVTAAGVGLLAASLPLRRDVRRPVSPPPRAK